MKIRNISDADIEGGAHKQWTLDPSLDVPGIMAYLDIKDLGPGDKTSHEWYFEVETDDGDIHQCGIWDYRGAQWSAYGNFSILTQVFGTRPWRV